jgi:hypothetical protein
MCGLCEAVTAYLISVYALTVSDGRNHTVQRSCSQPAKFGKAIITLSTKLEHGMENVGIACVIMVGAFKVI